MKIYGSGIDIVNIKRLNIILKNNKQFMKRIFSENEIKDCYKKKEKIACLAKRFSAKEAFSKSLGTGISKGLIFKEIEIIKDSLGKPILNIKGNSLKIVQKILKKKKFNTFLSISDDKPYAVASVILTHE